LPGPAGAPGPASPFRAGRFTAGAGLLAPKGRPGHAGRTRVAGHEVTAFPLRRGLRHRPAAPPRRGNGADALPAGPPGPVPAGPPGPVPAGPPGPVRVRTERFATP
ncbi:hypothetical protein F8144_44540, partial [Streptomyces triticiradicis]